VGLNFADEGEAEYFRQVIETKLDERRQRLERKGAAKRNSVGSAIFNGAPAPLPPSSTG